MSLRDGLANLRAARSEEQQEQDTPPTAPVPVEKTAQRTAPATRTATSEVPRPAEMLEKRETFSTRIRPSVRYALKRQLLDMQERGERVRMEDVLEALILRYVEDEAFRAEIGEKLRL